VYGEERGWRGSCGSASIPCQFQLDASLLFPAQSELHRHFMSLVVDVYQSPALAGTSYPADLEPAFM
jgi:hypothetical protein